MLLLTVLSPVGYFIFETSGIKYTSPTSASLIIATIPIFSTIIAMIFLKEKMTPFATLGVFISFLGVYLIVSYQTASVYAPKPLLGNMLVFGAAIYLNYCKIST